MPTITLPNNWRPRPYQMPAWTALEQGVKRILLFWHRRSGKDDLALHWTATQSVQNVGNYWHMLPEQTQARKAIWDAVNPHTKKRRIDEAFPLAIRASTINDQMLIRFKNGSSWQLVGSDNYNSLVGATPIGVVFSEWALAKPAAWAYLRPILAENGGWAAFITTVRGKNHAHKMYEAVKDLPEWFVQVLPAKDTDVFTEQTLKDELNEYIGTYGEDEGRALFNQEYGCSFDAPVLGSIYGKDIRQLEADGRVCNVPYDPMLKVHTIWDLGNANNMRILLVQKLGSEIRVIDHIPGGHDKLSDYVATLENRKYRYGVDYIPHDGASKEMGTGKSTEEMLREMNRNVYVIPVAPVEQGIAATKMIWPRVYVDKTKCKEWLNSNKLYKRHVSKEGVIGGPVHDDSSHDADTARYLATVESLMQNADWDNQPIKYAKLGYR